MIRIFKASGMGLFAVALLVAPAFLIAPGAGQARQDGADIPFTSQAPFGNWAKPWQDFCEEASIVMAAHFVWGLPLSPEIADYEMHLISRYELVTLGRHKDTSIREVADVLKNLYGFTGVELKKVQTIDDIKQQIDDGNIVIAPFAGRMLHNPHFVPPGPTYHMVVVHGYDDATSTFIVHEPGTRWGKNFRYGQRALVNAIHDWNGGNVLEGERVVLVVGR